MNYNYNEASMGWLSNSNFSGASYKQRGWSVPHLVGYMESHDEERMMYKNITYGNSSNPHHNIQNLDIALQRQKLAGAFFFTIPGPKMIWQFGELGYDISIEENGRTGRKPIHWDYYDNDNRRSLYNTWAELIKLRKDFPAFTTDNFSVSLSGAAKRINLSHNDMDVVITGNFDVYPNNVTVTFPSTGVWYEYFTQTNITVDENTQTFSMAPSEYRMYTTSYINREDYIVGIPEVKPGSSKMGITLWPNPVSSKLNISFYSEIKESIDIKLYDTSGKFLFTIFKGYLPAGQQTISWSIPNGISHGIYIVDVQTSSNQTSKRIAIH